ncbi:MAG TPA: hypothetical protein VGZ00_08960 [Candidatus Baltobacteraceae bacterium]|jgi:hypothetical protein|nr:hypothetical protein [Candidatus Baltobacteraceae bacterium]
MSIKEICFFRELDHGSPAGPSLQEERGKLASDKAPNICEYLRNAGLLAATGTFVDDWFDGSKKNVAPREVRTDGEWAWLGDLAYYVEKYQVGIPQEFISHMAERQWVPPKLSDAQLIKAANDYLSQR